MWGEPQGQTIEYSVDYNVERNDRQLRGELTEDGSTTTTAKAEITKTKQEVRWTSEMEDRLVDLWQQHKCLYNISCKTYRSELTRRGVELILLLQ